MNAIRLRVLNNIPNNAFVHVPNPWKITGQALSNGGFDVQPVYTDGSVFKTETELLIEGVALFRVQLDRFTVRDFKINPNAGVVPAFPKGRW